ncbi:unnamed protein product [Caenorhabditis sp. 36 PRJEB53466]|nr:unnamed protein product [Caenorhabditis sp. 36 PRJEB53466]
MYRVSRDSSCFSNDDPADVNPRFSGALELFEIAVWPGAVFMLIFVLLLVNNKVNIEKQKHIRRRFQISHIRKWHMHSQMVDALKRLQKEEIYRRISNEENFEHRRNLETVVEYIKEVVKAMKIANAKKTRRQAKKAAETRRQYKRIAKYLGGLQTGGVFGREDAGNVMWSATDRAINHLMFIKTSRVRKPHRPEPVADLNYLYR